MNGKYGVVALDFDGTIRDWHTSEPIGEAATYVRRLHKRGWRLVVFTCNTPAWVWQWLFTHGLDRYIDEVTNTKPVADWYVDDRAIPFTGSWHDVYHHIQGTA